MNLPKVSRIQLPEPLVVIGKTFIGDYSDSSKYAAEVQAAAETSSINFEPLKVIGIYYDNPFEKPAAELKSFHGVFPTNPESAIQGSLEKLVLSGDFLSVTMQGNPSDPIMDGYNALFEYIRENNVQLKSAAGFQISSFNQGEISLQIMMQV